MKNVGAIVILVILVSSCTFEPVLTTAEKNETIISPILYLVFMIILIVISYKPIKPKKNH